MYSALKLLSCFLFLTLSACGGGGNTTEEQFPADIATENSDLLPDNFSFSTVSMAEPGETVNSELKSISGINSQVPINIMNGEYSINGGAYTAQAGVIENGQTLTVRVQSNTTLEGSTVTTITMGGTGDTISVDFTVNTRPENILPLAEIIYPWPSSMITGSSILVRGTAKDNSDIASVTVGNVAATLSNRRALTEGFEVDWQLELSDISPSFIYDVIVVDTKGNENISADTFTLKRGANVPYTFDHLDENGLILGMSGWSLTMVDPRLGSSTSVVLDSWSSAACYHPPSDEYFYFHLAENAATNNNWANESEAVLAIHSYNLTTKTTQIWGSFNAALSAGSESVSTHYTELECNTGNNTIFAVASLDRSDGNISTTVARLNIDTLSLAPVITTGDSGYENWYVSESTSSEGYLTTLQNVSEGKITVFNSETVAAVNTLEGYNIPSNSNLNRGLAADIAGGHIYYSTDTDVYSIALTDSDVAVVSEADANDPLSFSQVNEMLWSADGLLSIFDYGLNQYIQINRENGMRSLFFSDFIGEGDKFSSGNSMVKNSDESFIYVLDTGTSGPPKVIAVNLANGNRTALAVIPDISGLVYHADITLDNITGKLYTGLNDKIFEIDTSFAKAPESNAELIASIRVGTGQILQAVDGLDVDEETKTLYIADPLYHGIIALNLATGERTVVSSNGVKGTGQALTNTNGIVLTSTALYATVPEDGLILRINPVTGDRATIDINSCLSSDGTTRDLSESRMYGIRYNPKTNALLVPGNSTRSINLATDECIFETGIPYLDMVASNNGGLFTLGFSELRYLHTDYSQPVLISK
ncbi:hypothetical protein [Teredinibacter haidensis]|uniref:hypothetical protein n=1 Tax=Teredinibacter haidensis TaxID=2731755 RepID=UPI0009489228|nr:hypothetical protein [Teredinibacter haidensis]